MLEEDVYDLATTNKNKTQPTYEESIALSQEENKESLTVKPFEDRGTSITNESMQSIRYRSLASQFVKKQKKILVNRYEWIKALGEGAFGQVILCKQIDNQ